MIKEGVKICGFKLLDAAVTRHNPYQSIQEYFHGRWRCPECETMMYPCGSFGPMILTDGTLKAGNERKVECIQCDFEEVVTNNDKLVEGE